MGSHLLYELCKKKVKTKALYRTLESLNKVKKIFGYYTDEVDTLFNQIEWVQGDITDITSLEDAFTGITQVYHCAALISFNPSDYKKLLKINQEGTANMVNISLAFGISKFCYVSSIATIGRPLGNKLADEETEFNATNASVYALAKQEAELEVWRGSQEGLDVLVVNPGVILGPGFWSNGSGQFFSKNAKTQSYYLPGGTGFIAVQDVVRCMLLLQESSITNERFILISENLTFKEVQQQIANAFSLKPPKKVIKTWMLQLGWRLDWLRNVFIKKNRVLTKTTALSLLEPTMYSNKKIKNTLDYQFEPVEQTIKATCRYYQKEQG